VFWERLCYLGEQPDFPRAKGEFRKFGLVRVRDDPGASIERPTDRVPDTGVIGSVLRKLEESASLGDFYSSQFSDAAGRRRQIAKCVSTVRKVLEEHEQRYLAFVQNIVNLFPRAEALRLSDHVKNDYILALAKSYRGVDVKKTYVYFSYILHRTLRFIRDDNRQPDPNDYEDSRMCLHLRLNAPCCVITDDGGTRDALRDTVSLLERLADPELRAVIEVQDTNFLRSL
jgi:hypothetical protein